MGLKEFVNRMAEKQAESNAKIKENKEKMGAIMDKLRGERVTEIRNRVQQLKKDRIPYCPKCYSTSLTYVTKKFSLGRTIVGGAIGTLINPIAGGAGAVLGGLSSSKGKVKCLNCGHTWRK